MRTLPHVLELILRRAVQIKSDSHYISRALFVLPLVVHDVVTAARIANNFLRCKEQKCPRDCFKCLSAFNLLDGLNQKAAADIFELILCEASNLTKEECIEALRYMSLSNDSSCEIFRSQKNIALLLGLLKKKRHELSPRLLNNLLLNIVRTDFRHSSAIMPFLEMIPLRLSEFKPPEATSIFGSMNKLQPYVTAPKAGLALWDYMVEQGFLEKLDRQQILWTLIALTCIAPEAQKVDKLLEKVVKHISGYNSEAHFTIIRSCTQLKNVSPKYVTTILGFVEQRKEWRRLDAIRVLHYFNKLPKTELRDSATHYLLDNVILANLNELPYDYASSLLDSMYHLKVSYPMRPAKLLYETIIAAGQGRERKRAGSRRDSNPNWCMSVKQGAHLVLGLARIHMMHPKDISPLPHLKLAEDLCTYPLDAADVCSLFLALYSSRAHCRDLPPVTECLCDALIPVVNDFSLIAASKILIALHSTGCYEHNKQATSMLWKRARAILQRNIQNAPRAEELQRISRAKAVTNHSTDTELHQLILTSVSIALDRGEFTLGSLGVTMAGLASSSGPPSDLALRIMQKIPKLPFPNGIRPEDIHSHLYSLAMLCQPVPMDLVRYVLSLSKDFEICEFRDIMYIWRALARMDCPKDMIPEALITRTYEISSGTSEYVDMGNLLYYLRKLFIDYEPLTHKLITDRDARGCTWVDRAGPRDLATVLERLETSAPCVTGNFLDALAYRIATVRSTASGSHKAQIAYSLCVICIQGGRAALPKIVHDILDDIHQQATEMTIHDVIFVLRATFMSNHKYGSDFLESFYDRIRSFFDTSDIALLEINSAIHALVRLGFKDPLKLEELWEAHKDRFPSKKGANEVRVARVIDRTLDTMATCEIVHEHHIKFLVPKLQELRLPSLHPVICRIYASMAIIQQQSSIFSSETLDYVRSLSMDAIRKNSVSSFLANFTLATALREKTESDDEAVATILINLPRSIRNANMKSREHICKALNSLRELGIDLQDTQWLSESGRVRRLVDLGWITQDHVVSLSQTAEKLPEWNTRTVETSAPSQRMLQSCG